MCYIYVKEYVINNNAAYIEAYISKLSTIRFPENRLVGRLFSSQTCFNRMCSIVSGPADKARRSRN